MHRPLVDERRWRTFTAEARQRGVDSVLSSPLLVADPAAARCPFELEAYLENALEPTARQHNLIVHAINEPVVEAGEDHPVPYIEDPSGTAGAEPDPG